MVAYSGCGCLCVVLAFSRFCYALMRLCVSLVVVISACLSLCAYFSLLCYVCMYLGCVIVFSLWYALT